MKKLFIPFILVLGLISCNKQEKKVLVPENKDTTSVKDMSPQDLEIKSMCYVGNTGKDSVFVSLDDNLGTVTGKIFYKNNEKDSSKGDVVGFKSGDTLKLTYEFKSEGTTSKRDIFFLQKDDKLIEGIGNVKEENGQTMYADEKKIVYKDGGTLEKADCLIVMRALK
ncbi:hypothetical protein ASG01_01705 [Chryseobacterium sp. Leaf180]|uniref:hypothetical protein n=1 Tax=Chryseobacterium sp. Leaf180 TaxID=1736289 RepID=UPI0006FB3FB2|nr:hypothetical protein [Chryseobacterium sp. Leaf180]KQR94622.1 hypothetical protein ASG01_01705 [Chryseobacterium sp. Leaf180]